MATELNKFALAKSKGISQEPELILEIDGVSTKYSIFKIKKYIKIGDTNLFIDGSWTIGGFNNVDDQESLISWEGSSTTITQQLLQDKGNASSVSAIQIALQDKNGKATELVSPGAVVTDILGRKAKVWLGYKNTPFPESFTVIFSGVIDETDSGAAIVLNIAHPEARKRVDIFQEGSTVLTQDADFRSATIQSILWLTRRGVVGTLNVTYADTTTSGSETATAAGNNITVNIESGVSTASQVRNAVENSIAVLSLAEIDILDGQTGVAQTATGPISLDSDTTLTVEDTTTFLTPADSGTLKTYVRINDEVIEYTGKTATTFTGCVREALVAFDPRARGSQHEADDEVKSFYRLQGNAFDLALKIMLSSENEYFLTGQTVTSFVTVPDLGDIPNAIYFSGINVQDVFGLVVGDFVTTINDDYAANNFTLRTITEVVVLEAGSYIVVDGAALTANPATPATISFKSKYNVLPANAGLGLGSDQVDVPEFERLNEIFFSSIFTYDFYLTETEKGKGFIDQDILFPTGAYTIPRKGKISVGFTSPPLSVSLIPNFNSSNVARPQQNRIKRTINRYFYNNVVFKYNPTVLESDRFLSGDITVDADSKNQIQGFGNKSFTITARGLRPSSENSTIIDLIAERLLERYRFAAESTKAQMFYGESFNIDVGDTVLYGDNDLKLIDTRRATRGFTQRVFEVVNKSLNIKSGEVILDLVDTNYLNNGRYGVFGPASLIGSGATSSSIPVVNSFGWNAPRTEKEKWEPYINTKVLVHDDLWTDAEETTFIGFDPNNNSVLLLDPPLSFTPSADYIIEQPNYYGAEPDIGAQYKNAHDFFDPDIPIVSGTSSTVFDVSAPDAAKIFAGATIRVYKTADWSVVSPEVKVSSVVGTTVTVDISLGFTPDNTYSLDLVGFIDDEGAAYRWL